MKKLAASDMSLATSCIVLKKRTSEQILLCSDVVRLTGLEPVRPEDTSTSSLPVYQFQHSRILMVLERTA